MSTLEQRIQWRFMTLIDLMRETDQNLSVFAEFQRQVDALLKRTVPESLVVGFGSFMRQTTIRTSDMDLLWIIPPERVRSGEKLRSAVIVMDELMSALRQHIDPSWRLERSSPALIIRPERGIMEVNVVPTPPYKGRPGLTGPGALLAQQDGRWKFAAPIAQRDYLLEAATESRNVLIFVARFFKFWRTLQVPKVVLPSYYVEYVLHCYKCCVGKLFVDATLLGFRALDATALSGIPDPLGIDRRLFAAPTIEGRRRLARALARVIPHVVSVRAALLVGDEAAAMKSLNRIFSGNFPSYETKRKDLGWGQRAIRTYPGTRMAFPPAFLEGYWQRPSKAVPSRMKARRT